MVIKFIIFHLNFRGYCDPEKKQVKVHINFNRDFIIKYFLKGPLRDKCFTGGFITMFFNASCVIICNIAYAKSVHGRVGVG